MRVKSGLHHRTTRLTLADIGLFRLLLGRYYQTSAVRPTGGTHHFRVSLIADEDHGLAIFAGGGNYIMYFFDKGASGVYALVSELLYALENRPALAVGTNNERFSRRAFVGRKNGGNAALCQFVQHGSVVYQFAQHAGVCALLTRDLHRVFHAETKAGALSHLNFHCVPPLWRQDISCNCRGIFPLSRPILFW